MILDAATEEFASLGFEGASYNRIIERSGVSKGAMYYYFDDKEDLYLTVLSHAIQSAREALGDIPEVETAEEYWEALETISYAAMEFYYANPVVSALVRGLARVRRSGSIPAAIEEMHRNGVTMAEHYLKVGQRVGAVRRDLPFELLANIVTAVDEVFDWWFLDNEARIAREAQLRMVSVMLGTYRRLVTPTPDLPEDDGAGYFVPSSPAADAPAGSIAQSGPDSGAETANDE